MDETKMLELSDDALDSVSGGLQPASPKGSGTPDDPYVVAGRRWAVGDRVQLDNHPVGDIPCNEYWDVYGIVTAVHIRTDRIFPQVYLDLILSCCGAKIYDYSTDNCSNLSR